MPIAGLRKTKKDMRSATSSGRGCGKKGKKESASIILARETKRATYFSRPSFARAPFSFWSRLLYEATPSLIACEGDLIFGFLSFLNRSPNCFVLEANVDRLKLYLMHDRLKALS